MTTQDTIHELEEPVELADPTANTGTTSLPANTEKTTNTGTTSLPANTGTTSTPANTNTADPADPITTGISQVSQPPTTVTDWDAYEDKVIYIFLGSYLGVLLLFLLFYTFRKK